MIFFAGALFTVLVGLLEQYLCRRFGASNKFAVILPLNKSTWEQLKALFWPMLIFSAFEYFDYGMYYDNFAAAKAASVLIAVGWSVALTYIYDAIWGNRTRSAEICIFVLSAATGWIAELLLIKNYCLYSQPEKLLGITAVLILMICFAVFSAVPPQKSIFREKNV